MHVNALKDFSFDDDDVCQEIVTVVEEPVTEVTVPVIRIVNPEGTGNKFIITSADYEDNKSFIDQSSQVKLKQFSEEVTRSIVNLVLTSGVGDGNSTASFELDMPVNEDQVDLSGDGIYATFF